MDIDLVFGEGRLVVKGIPQGGLCIMCERQANYSLLNITLEQGLELLRGDEVKGLGEQTAQALDGLKEIAKEILGDHAHKVIPILESAGSETDELSKAIEQVEKMTRMFIDKKQAGIMAQRMRDMVIKSS
jgi:hypothetical protein